MVVLLVDPPFRSAVRRRRLVVGGVTRRALYHVTWTLVSEERRRNLAGSEGRLRDFLISLFSSGEPMRAVSLPKVVDVDREADVRCAEELARGAAR